MSCSLAAFISLSFPAHAQDECGTVRLSRGYVLLVPVRFVFEDEVNTFLGSFAQFYSYLLKSQRISEQSRTQTPEWVDVTCVATQRIPEDPAV